MTVKELRDALYGAPDSAPVTMSWRADAIPDNASVIARVALVDDLCDRSHAEARVVIIAGE
ncbi:MAG: hypothetical protein Q4E20_03090 [Eubacteriales bacterium]|nr:hypothetical protein [Eubacteriales bacterium]